MKKIGLILALILAVACVSCSSGYSQSKADALVEKIDAGEELSQDEIGEAIQLCSAGSQKMIDLIDETKDLSDEEQAELKNDPKKVEEVQALFVSLMKLNSYLEKNDDSFNEANEKAFEQLKETQKELGKKMFSSK